MFSSRSDQDEEDLMNADADVVDGQLMSVVACSRKTP